MPAPPYGQSYLQLNLTAKTILSREAQNQACPGRNLYAQNRGSGLYSVSILSGVLLHYIWCQRLLLELSNPYYLSLKLFLIHGGAP